MAQRALFASALMLFIVEGVMMSDCAENVSNARQSNGVFLPHYLDAEDQITLVIASAPEVTATDIDKNHLATLLTERLNDRRTHNVAAGNGRQCKVRVLMTKLDTGSNLTHSFPAGLGQIRLEAFVLVTPVGGGATLNAFTISKTVALRGKYDASEELEDIEPAFADGIAAALTGQPAGADV